VANDNARTFLDAAGWGNAAREPLTGDASARKNVRLRQAGRTAILMDASHLPEIVAPFIRIDEHLRQLGFSAPEILARDEANGLLVLEDFGDATFAQLLDQPRSSRDNEAQTEIGNRQSAIGNEPEPPHVGSYNPEQLFALATDVLIALHRHPRAIPENLRAYSPKKMLADIELFLEVERASSPSSGQDARATNEFRKAWREVLPVAHQVPVSLLLRDYHAANLMLLPERNGIRRAGLLDFQDAYQGPITYDLVSLIEDARRDVPEELRRKMIARYLAQFPSLDRDAFETSMAILAAVRHTRVLAIFEKLSREGKTDYKRLHSPRVERLLQNALRHPILAGVKRWFEEYANLD
jgi:aminoglycoside/choline kinase family phosphotransferase